jgi:hypothetical protein
MNENGVRGDLSDEYLKSKHYPAEEKIMPQGLMG